MGYLKLVASFARASAQNELAYRANFWISLLYALLNAGSGILGVMVLFGQVESVQGWDLPATMALLGVYLSVGALRELFIGPSLNALAGMDGEIWTGRFDFTLLRPINAQFQASLRYWRPLALIDLALGLAVLGMAVTRLRSSLTLVDVLAFLVTLLVAVMVLYAILLALTALVLWSPSFLFTWVFDAVFQMARYPVGVYPGWLRLVLTWVIPVGIITTVPAQTLTGMISTLTLLGSIILAFVFFVGATILFQRGLRQYTSASS